MDWSQHHRIIRYAVIKAAVPGLSMNSCALARVTQWGVLPKCDVTDFGFLVLGGRVCGCLEGP